MLGVLSGARQMQGGAEEGVWAHRRKDVFGSARRVAQVGGGHGTFPTKSSANR